ncbi:MAG TPA: 30S ribosomal protein S12 methylthiotransferase RimO [Methylomirabilota bacterium]|jgi:ribosomal protein S12 methylthiotransferase|nr:30S ribosomal protein S12 methylthiotransferase RimO [Methylomirabilota bacterium]
MNVHLLSLGCPKNQVDGELMLGLLAQDGVAPVDRAEAADCVVVNTCAFIDRAKQESIETILELATWKAAAPGRRLVVTGCLPQRYGAELLTEMPEIDALVGTGELPRIVDVVRRLDARAAWIAGAPPGYVYRADAPRVRLGRVPYAYVKIAEGCSMGCTFCAIPLMRGRHRSRPLGDIVTEVAALARDGVQEVVLVSQDTLAWGKDLPGPGRSDFGDLLLALSETAVPWLRYLYLHPAHVTDRLIAKLGRARALPYVDMPIQHADDAVLRAMRRGVTGRRMAEIVAALRDAIPGATLRTTVLVGFPGETDAAFETLLAFLDEVRFDRVGSFVYSAEEGTPAAALAAPVPAEVAEERARLVQETQDRMAWERQAALLGSVQDVLIDGPSQDPAFAWEGRTGAQAPEIDGVVYVRDRDLAPGRRVPLEIVEVDGYDLVGILARR